MCWALHGSGEAGKYKVEPLPLGTKVIASEKDTPANKA